MEMQFQQLQRQVQELLDRESPQDGLLSATQLTQVQSLVQGSLNETIERAASAAAQAAVRAFSSSPSQAPDQENPLWMLQQLQQHPQAIAHSTRKPRVQV